MSSNIADRPVAKSWSHRLSQQPTRRALVWVWALACAALVFLGVFEITGPVWFVLLALALTVDFFMFVATRRVADRPTSSLDEREQLVRNRAYRTAYIAVFYVTLVVVGGAMMLFYTGNEWGARWFAHPASHSTVLTGFGIVVLQVSALLPTAMIAWTEEDDPGEID